MSFLKVENLSVRFGGLRAIEDMSFEVREGEVLSLIGPNGAGKTTAFNAITGYLAPSSGDIRSEEHTSELQSHSDLVCRLLLEKKKKKKEKGLRCTIRTSRSISSAVSKTLRNNADLFDAQETTPMVMTVRLVITTYDQ